MKKSSEVQGLPIISIADGVEIGQAKSLIINPEKRSIDFVTIGHEEWEQEGKAIPFNKIIGIGDYALTIDHESSVIEMNNIPVANELLNRKTKIEQTRLMTKKGQLIGQAVEYMIDDETGEIVQLFVKDNEGSFIVNGQYVVTYGRDLIIVSEDVVKESLEVEAEKPHLANIEPDKQNEEKEKNAVLPGEKQRQEADNELYLVEGKLNPALETAELTDQEARAEHVLEEADEQLEESESPEVSSIDRWLQLIDDQQSKLLNGKTTTKDIELNGELLIPAGAVLNEEHIQKARLAGPEILVELSMNSEA
ncbi:PRC-barrel domain-containing protein [Domibacillus tundrae]|uniref:PRC-barrel domain-containing protein n=1 Tax=Domibacillus tundrae TaxID=1587527 RepID=UPI000617E0C1|nr:PRC-barrel domain-containing protein [Domibacillus tundrae]